MTLITQRIESPNHSSRAGHAVRACVLHYTASNYAKSTAFWFADKISRVSSHFVIGRRGHIYQCVDLGNAAWHCEPAELTIGKETIHDLNESSIGIELANCGQLHRLADGWHYHVGDHLWPYNRAEPVAGVMEYPDGLVINGFWEPYCDTQLDSLQALLLKLSETYPEAVRNLVGHEEVAVPIGRKRDPGAAFPWSRFSRSLPRKIKSVVTK